MSALRRVIVANVQRPMNLSSALFLPPVIISKGIAAAPIVHNLFRNENKELLGIMALNYFVMFNRRTGFCGATCATNRSYTTANILSGSTPNLIPPIYKNLRGKFQLIHLICRLSCKKITSFVITRNFRDFGK